VPRVRAAAVVGSGDRGDGTGSAQHLRRDQARAGAPRVGVGVLDRRRRGRPAIPQRLRPLHAAGHPVCRGRRDLPQRTGGRPGPAGVRGWRPATRLRARHRRRRGEPPGTAGRSAGVVPARLQRRLGTSAHRRGHGPGAGRRDRRSGARGHRRLPDRRRAARGREPRPGRGGTRFPGAGGVRGRHARLRDRSPAPRSTITRGCGRRPRRRSRTVRTGRARTAATAVGASPSPAAATRRTAARSARSRRAPVPSRR
jgi:hypothetical protein